MSAKVDHGLPAPFQYYLRQMTVALGGETFFRHFKLDQHVNMNSLTEMAQRFDDWTGNAISSHIPVAMAQDVEEIIVEEVAETVKESAENVFSEAPGVTDLSEKGWMGNVQEFIQGNKEWLALTSSVILTSSVVNHLSSRKIKNAWVRNGFSLGMGVGVTYLTATYGFQRENALREVSDVALRFLASHNALKFSAFTLSKVVTYGAPMARWAHGFMSMKMSFQPLKDKVKSN